MGRAAIALLVVIGGCGRLGFDDHFASGDDQAVPDGSPAMAMAPTAGLIAYWPFDSLAGEATADVVGGNTATCATGACPVIQAGVVAGALAFDGASTCLEVPSLTSWSNDQFTISAWVMSADLDGPVVAHEGYNACPSPLMNTRHSLLGLTQVSDAGPHNEAWTQAPIAGTGDWHHIAVAWDGITQMVFVDGVCSCNAVPTIATHQYTDQFSLGCYPKQATFFHGVVDDVRIYDRVLAFDEMTMLIAAAGRDAPNPVSCVDACSTVAP